MKAIIIALAVFMTGYAHAEENPTVKAADNANVAFVQCLEKVMAAVEKIQTESTRVMMIEGAPDKCARNIRSPVVAKDVSTADRGWAFAQFLVGAVAQYKGQALIWNGLTAMMGRSADSTDNAVNQGFNTANNSLDSLGNLATDAINKPPVILPAAPAPAAPASPALSTVTMTPAPPSSPQ